MSYKRKSVSTAKKSSPMRKKVAKKSPPKEKYKNVLLVTENIESEFSRKVIRATKIAKKKLIIDEAKFSTLSKILTGNIGVVVVDRDEVGGGGDHFHRTIRMFRSHTPVLMPFSQKIILEQLFSQAYKRNISTPDLAKVLTKAAVQSREMDKAVHMTYSFEKDIKLESLADLIIKSLKFDKALDRVNKKFSKEVNKIKHLTGNELTIALERIRKDAFKSPAFKHMQSEIKKRVESISNESHTFH